MDQQTGNTPWGRAEGTPSPDLWEQASLEDEPRGERVSGPLSPDLLERQKGQPALLVPMQTPLQPQQVTPPPRKRSTWPLVVFVVGIVMIFLPVFAMLNRPVISSPPPEGNLPNYTQTQASFSEPTQTVPPTPPITVAEATITPARSGAFTEFSLPTGGNPNGIVVGPDGAIWFTLKTNGHIGHLTPDGHFQEFSGVTLAYGLEEIAVGPDGKLWFIDGYDNQLGRLSADGTYQQFDEASGRIADLTAGPDGNVWFTEPESNKIGRISPAGQVQEFTVPTPGSGPLGITTGPDGNLWFTESDAYQIGRLTPAGVIQEFRLSSPDGGYPYAITTGADQRLWIMEPGRGRMVRMAINGTMQEFRLPFINTFASRLAVGTDGNVWFTDIQGNKIGRITSAGGVSEFAIPTHACGVIEVAAGAQGTIWFTELLSNKIGELKLNK
jgi:virginiamycin B lyase